MRERYQLIVVNKILRPSVIHLFQKEYHRKPTRQELDEAMPFVAFFGIVNSGFERQYMSQQIGNAIKGPKTTITYKDGRYEINGTLKKRSKKKVMEFTEGGQSGQPKSRTKVVLRININFRFRAVFEPMPSDPSKLVMQYFAWAGRGEVRTLEWSAEVGP